MLIDVDAAAAAIFVHSYIQRGCGTWRGGGHQTTPDRTGDGRIVVFSACGHVLPAIHRFSSFVSTRYRNVGIFWFLVYILFELPTPPPVYDPLFAPTPSCCCLLLVGHFSKVYTRAFRTLPLHPNPFSALNIGLLFPRERTSSRKGVLNPLFIYRTVCTKDQKFLFLFFSLLSRHI